MVIPFHKVSLRSTTSPQASGMLNHEEISWSNKHLPEVQVISCTSSEQTEEKRHTLPIMRYLEPKHSGSGPDEPDIPLVWKEIWRRAHWFFPVQYPECISYTLPVFHRSYCVTYQQWLTNCCPAWLDRQAMNGLVLRLHRSFSETQKAGMYADKECPCVGIQKGHGAA